VASRIHDRTGGKLTLVGPFQPPELEASLSGPKVDEAVEYLGVLPPAEARRVMAEAKVGLLLFQRSRAHERSMPNKLFEYMASGVPVVASDFPHWREIIEAADAGVVVPPDDVDAIERVAADLLADPERAERQGGNGRLAATERYTWASEAATLLALYDDLLNR
jgi:glycosyltransferase involved in cell wall biosynthesis